MKWLREILIILSIIIMISMSIIITQQKNKIEQYRDNETALLADYKELEIYNESIIILVETLDDLNKQLIKDGLYSSINGIVYSSDMNSSISELVDSLKLVLSTAENVNMINSTVWDDIDYLIEVIIYYYEDTDTSIMTIDQYIITYHNDLYSRIMFYDSIY